MMRPLPLLFLAASAFAQTAVFPNSAATNSQLKVQVNGVQTSLTSTMNTTTLSATVFSCLGIIPNTLATIDTEILPVNSCFGNAITFASRGFDNSTAANHFPPAVVNLYIEAWHHNALRVEVEAIEASLLGTSTLAALVAASLTVPSAAPATGLAYACFNTSGRLVSQASPCAGSVVTLTLGTLTNAQLSSLTNAQLGALTN